VFVASQRYEGVWFRRHVFSFLYLSVRGFGSTICCLNLPLFWFSSLLPFLVIPWSLDRFVNILPTNETEGQQLLDLSKKKSQPLWYLFFSCK
jgi:hypothetical protein